MSELNNRAWHKKEKKYYNPVYLLGKEVFYSFEGNNSFDHIGNTADFIVEQYTGRDNVYKNDIIELTYMTQKFKGVVKYNKAQMAYEVEVMDENFKLLMVEIESIDKILGSVHEGIELSEADKIFEELGFEKIQHSKSYVEYRFYENEMGSGHYYYIKFIGIQKRVDMGYYDTTDKEHRSISLGVNQIKVLKAIIMKIEEMGINFEAGGR